MISSTQPLLDEIKDSSDDEFSSQRRRRQQCLSDVSRRRTCEGSNVAVVAKLLEVEQAVDNKTKNGSDSNLHRLKVMNHSTFRKLSESRGINLPIIEMKRTQSAQPNFPPTFISDDEYSPITQVMKFSDSISINDRSTNSQSQSFIQKSTSTTELLNIRIFFCDGKCIQFTVEDGSKAQSSDLLHLIAEHLDIPEEVVNSVFALWLVSPLLEVQLKPHHVANEVRNKWASFLKKYTNASEMDIAIDEPLLILRRNVNLTIETERMFEQDYEKIVDILYLDAKDEYLTGRYLVSEIDVALELAALQLLIEYGPYDATKDKEAEATLDLVHDKLSEFVPSQYLSRIRSFQLFGLSVMECKQGLEKYVVQHYKDFSNALQNQFERKREYLNILRKTPFYGAAFFNGKTDRRSSTLPLFVELGKRFFTGSTPTARMSVRIGIQSKYITIVDPVKSEILLTQKIEDCNWLKSPNSNDPEFFLHFPDPDFVTPRSSNETLENNIQQQNDNETPASKILQIFTKQAYMMVALLDSLDQIAVSELGSAHDLSHTIISASASDGENVLSSSDESDSQYSHFNHQNSTSKEFIKSSKASSKASSKSYKTTATTSSSVPSNVSSSISNNQPRRQSRASSLTMNNYGSGCLEATSCRNKLSKLCLATLDPKGCCIEAQGSLKKLFVSPVH